MAMVAAMAAIGAAGCITGSINCASLPRAAAAYRRRHV